MNNKKEQKIFMKQRNDEQAMPKSLTHFTLCTIYRTDRVEKKGIQKKNA